MIGRTFLGRYQALRVLGEGGMGRVYLARQVDLGRQVVVKVMHDHLAAAPEFRERFQRETLVMAHFQHPYAVTLIDASLDDPKGPCIIMEYVRGITLDALLHRHGRLSATRLSRLVSQLCEVLQAAHGEGIVHRDLKPTNLMVIDADTPYEKIKVMDFGLAKLVSMPNMRITDASAQYPMGTPAYICPEQAKGDQVDHRGDIYSVGVILYELLTGHLPFRGKSTMDILLAHATEPAPTFAAAEVDSVPPAVEGVVQACLAKDPEQRPASARDLAEMYEAALIAGHQDELPPPPPDAASPAPSSRSKLGAQDPSAVIHELEAWMPEQVAAHKLRGFVHDIGGEVINSEPGLIRVRLGLPGPGRRSWLGLSRKTSFLEMELHLERGDASRENQLNITVLMRSADPDLTADSSWRERCDKLYIELRGYLMGRTGSASELAG